MGRLPFSFAKQIRGHHCFHVPLKNQVTLSVHISCGIPFIVDEWPFWAPDHQIPKPSGTQLWLFTCFCLTRNESP